MLKKILRISLWLLLIAGLILVYGFVQKNQSESACTKLHISIERNPADENFLVEEDDIRKLIALRFGQVENMPQHSVDVNLLERILYSNPWIERAEVYMQLDGRVDIEIQQRKPLFRVINSYGESYYMDIRGRLMPWSAGFTANVPVFTGNITERFDEWSRVRMDELINNDTLKTQTLLDDFYALAKFILANEFWSAQAEQLYINQYGDIELVPKVGNHKIIFGAAGEMEEKFWKLKTFYKEGLNYTGWENYDTLNLKFRNQVVCTKKIKDSSK